MKFLPHPYQEFAIRHIVENEIVESVGGAGLFLEMGLGKTVSTLTAIKILKDQRKVKKVLVIAPLRVAQHTWPSELKKWDHLDSLTVSIAIGTEKARRDALRAKADIYCINRENVPWLVAECGGSWPFDMVVIDELSSFKSPSSGRFKALRPILPFIKRRVGLTGTPAPNTVIDLWSQLYLLDRGERLGKSVTKYRQKYFNEGRKNGHVVYDYRLKEGDDLLGEDIYTKEIYDKIGDICVSMKAEDWLQMPPLVDNDIIIDMPASVRKQYRQFERESVLQLEDRDDVSALSAASLTNKLIQYSNGAVYDDQREAVEVHRLKIQALEEVLEAANGNPVLCFYSFRHDLQRIKQYLKAYKPQELRKGAEGVRDLDRWNAGEIPFLLAHPASAGHGLNMQDGGNHMVWFGLPWSLELYQQAVARLHRQGQKKSVINTRIVCGDTVEFDIINSLSRKADTQEKLMQALKARISRILKS